MEVKILTNGMVIIAINWSLVINEYKRIQENIRFKAFTTTKINKILPGFQPRQLEARENFINSREC
jgi:hypothetical protein